MRKNPGELFDFGGASGGCERNSEGESDCDNSCQPGEGDAHAKGHKQQSPHEKPDALEGVFGAGQERDSPEKS